MTYREPPREFNYMEHAEHKLDTYKAGAYLRGVRDLTGPVVDAVFTPSETGGVKGSKLCQLQWLPPDAMWDLGEVFGMGATKYGPNNYRLGTDSQLYIGAAMRHIMLHQGGETLDTESSKYHLSHAVADLLMAVQTLMDYGDRFDGRFDLHAGVEAEPDTNPEPVYWVGFENGFKHRDNPNGTTDFYAPVADEWFRCLSTDRCRGEAA